MTPAEMIAMDERLRSSRANLMLRWQEVAELIAPHEADFTVQRAVGQLRGLEQFDSAPATAAENFANGLWSLLTNPATTWFTLEPEAEALRADQEVRAWCEVVGRRMLTELRADGMRFYGAMLEFNRAMVRYGTALLYADVAPEGTRMRWWAPRLRDCVIAEDDEGRVDFVSRRWKWTARQAYARWGTRCGEAICKAMEVTPDREFEFLHVVRPNKERVPGARDARGKAFTSCYVGMHDRNKLEEGGLDRNPWVVGRWAQMLGTPYGYSPAMVALADTKTLNVMARTFIVSSQKAADPPILAPDENALGPIRIRPGGIIYGAVDMNGNQLVRPMEHRGAFTLTDAMMEAKRQAIRDAFLNSALEMPDRPNRTATEILQREEDRMRLMAPNLVRLQADVLDPLLEMIFGVMEAGGAFPPAPAQLAEAGGIVSVQYVSPLARAQRATEAQGILRAMEAVQAIAAVKPAVVQNFDLDRAARRVAETLGLPGDLMRSPELVVADRQAEAQAMAQAAQAEQAAAGVDAAATLAGAAAQAERAPNVLAALGVEGMARA
jgi:hypothetical protein